MQGPIICVFLFLTLAQAERNWCKIKTRVHPAFKHFSSDGSRIAGGEEANPHQFPYQVALFVTTSEGIFFCGGSLISQRYVLTAAHCVDGATQVEVVLGAHKIREDELSQKKYISSTFTFHNDWNSSTVGNDIALIELEEVPLNADIQLIPLPRYADVDKSFTGELATASGWGKDSDKSNTISEVLRYVESKVICQHICDQEYWGVIESTHICTSGSGGKCTCNGDSGGPLVIGTKQVGVASFGIIIGREAGWPAVFTRVTSYLDWIAANSDVAINKGIAEECM